MRAAIHFGRCLVEALVLLCWAFDFGSIDIQFSLSVSTSEKCAIVIINLLCISRLAYFLYTPSQVMGSNQTTFLHIFTTFSLPHVIDLAQSLSSDVVAKTLATIVFKRPELLVTLPQLTTTLQEPLRIKSK